MAWLLKWQVQDELSKVSFDIGLIGHWNEGLSKYIFQFENRHKSAIYNHKKEIYKLLLDNRFRHH